MPEAKPALIERIGPHRRIMHFADGGLITERRYDDGQLWYRVRHFRKAKDGLAEYWWPNGKMLRREHYRKGKLHGTVEGWREDGTQTKNERYTNGVRNDQA